MNSVFPVKVSVGNAGVDTLFSPKNLESYLRSYDSVLASSGWGRIAFLLQLWVEQRFLQPVNLVSLMTPYQLSH